MKSDGDGWPTVDTETMKELRNIFYNIIELNFPRDCDSSQGILFRLSDRKKEDTVLWIPTILSEEPELSKAKKYAKLAEQANEQVARCIENHSYENE